MLIHVAQNGRMYELDCQGATLVEVVHNTLAALTGIAASDQMLICGDTRLEGSKSLSYYKLPAEERRVFLFNRAALLPDSPPPGLEEIEIVELTIPQAPSLLDAGHPLDESPNPLLRALPSYERQFKYHLQKGQSIFRASQARYDICRRLVQEQQVQELALETACGNMGLYYNHICGAHKEFMEQFNRQHAQHSELLACFERDMERLRQCELHPALRSQSPLRRTLLDCVKESALRKWAHDCTISHALFASKVGELQTHFSELQRSVEDLLGQTPDVDVVQLEVRLEESHKYMEEQTSILQSLSKDLSTVKKLVEDCVGGRLTSSLRPLDACAALDPMNDVHVNSHLPRVETCDRKLSSLLQFTYESKTKMSRCVHTQLQTVAALQSRIRDLRNQLAVFREAMGRQDEIFAELSLVRRVASSYQACLAEVVRRKAFATLYMGQARQLAEKMARIREAELARREEFVHIHSPRYLPRDVLEGMGLLGAPCVCEVSVPDFDQNLLDIDVQDLALRLPGGRPGSQANRAATGGNQGEARGSLPSGEMDAVLEEREEQDEDEAANEAAEGFGKLEMENAWLRAELAAAMAGVHTMQAEAGVGGPQGASEEAETPGRSNKELALRTAEALRAKDAHTAHLQQALKAQENKTLAYEQRIRDLEARLQELEQQANREPQVETAEAEPLPQGSPSSSSHGNSGMDASGVTAQGHDQRPIRWQHGSVMQASRDLEAMDETGGETESVETSMGIAGTQTQILSASQQPEAPQAMQPSVQNQPSPHSRAETRTQDKARLELPNEDHQMQGGMDAATEHGDQPAGMPGARRQTQSPEVRTIERESVLEVGPVDRSGDEGQLQAWQSQQDKDKEAAAVAGQVAELQGIVAEQSAACSRVRSEAAEIQSQLKHHLALLSECQVNCAHLENQLHKAREEARTQRAAAERRGAEYASLRSESVHVRGILERLTRCLAPGASNGGPSAESLRGLAASLASQIDGPEANVPSGEWVRAAVRVLAERVATLAAERAHLLEKSALANAKIERLGKQLEEAATVLQVLAAKHERAEQAAQLGRQKICYTRFQVHELAAFIPSEVPGRYVAISRNCCNHFLSDESVALFRQHAQAQGQAELPPCIVGQVVHIERSVARTSSGISEEPASPANGKGRYGGNPYSLPLGVSFAVVTVAMVPDTAAMPAGNVPPPAPAPPPQPDEKPAQSAQSTSS